MVNEGLYDMTMLRFESEQRVGFREYMRADGTRSYFFCLDTVRDLFVAAGFIEVPTLLFNCHKKFSFQCSLLYKIKCTINFHLAGIFWC